MVDFNNETTITKSAIDIERILVLQKRDELILALSDYLVSFKSGVDRGEAINLDKKLYAFFFQFYATLKRKMNNFIAIEEKINNHNYEYSDVVDWFKEWSVILDDFRLTKLDIKVSRDRSNAIVNYEKDEKEEWEN